MMKTPFFLYDECRVNMANTRIQGFPSNQFTTMTSLGTNLIYEKLEVLPDIDLGYNNCSCNLPKFKGKIYLFPNAGKMAK